MSIFDALRSFLGLRPGNTGSQDHHGPRNFFIDENNIEEDDFDELYTDRSINSNRENFGFRMFSGDILEMHRFFEQQFDEIMKSFQSNWFQDFNEHNYSMIPFEEGHLMPEEGNPRNKFLKPAYIQPSLPKPGQIDQEIAHEVPSSKILDLFPDKDVANEKKKTNQLQPYSGSFQSSFSSQIIKKKFLPNGGVEEERKCIRDGKEETTLSRQLDGMKHIVTKSRLPDGTTETHEEFINMDEYKLADFNKAWSSNSSLSKPSISSENSPNPNLSDRNPSLLDILRQFI